MWSFRNIKNDLLKFHKTSKCTLSQVVGRQNDYSKLDELSINVAIKGLKGQETLILCYLKL